MQEWMIYWRRGVLPIAMLAVVLQMFLPIAAARALAASVDPLRDVSACVAAANQPSSDGGSVPIRGHECPLCPLALAQCAMLPAQSPGLPKPYAHTVRTIGDRTSSPNPRGLPTAWPNSRAPPAFS